MTIKDIARQCGVGVSTVSRVLNNRPDVSDEVRKAVLETVEKSGYIPNNSARDLVKNRSNSVGVIVRGTGNLFFADMLKTITAELSSKGYDMALRFISPEDDEVKAGAILEREKKLKGILFLGGRFNYTPQELALIGVPYVCCSYSNSFGSLAETDYSSVTIDDFETARAAVEHLIELGHRRIVAFFDCISDNSISQLRYGGYKKALEDAGIEYDPSLVVETGAFDMEHAYTAAKLLAERQVDFTAAFMESDETAIAFIKAMFDMGRGIPKDCSVIAIDGLKMSRYFDPTLTTMVQPADVIGCESVRILDGMIKGSIRSEHLFPKATLRAGGSVRRLLPNES